MRERRRAQSKKSYKNRVERGWKRKKNTWGKQFTKAAIKK